MATSRVGRRGNSIGGVVQDLPPFFSQIQLQNFRGIRDLVIDDLSAINIFTGRNGSGKTSVLEAIWLLCGLNNAGLIEVIARARALPIAPFSDLIFTSLFPKFDASVPVQLSGWVGRKPALAKRTLEIGRLSPNGDLMPLGSEGGAVPGLELIGRVGEHSLAPARIGFIRTRYGEHGEPVPVGLAIPEAVGLMGSPFVEHEHFIHAAFLRPGWRAPQRVHDLAVRATRDRTQGPVVDLLRSVFPELKDIVPLSEGGVPMIHADLGDGPLIPAPMLGSGFSNLLDIAIWVGTSEAQMVLIDELEDGLHYTALPVLAQGLLDINRRKGIQVIITTHSRDVVSAFANAAIEYPEDVAFFNLVSGDDQHRAVRYNCEETRKLLEINSDIR